VEITSQFFDGHYYTAESFAKAYRSLMLTGVTPDGNKLSVRATAGMVIKVTAGDGVIEGRTFQVDTDKLLTVSPSSGSKNRIDTVVIRQNLSGNGMFELLLVTGAYPASENAVPTAPIRNGTYYDLVLANINVSAGATSITQQNITDKRDDSAVCGIMSTAANGMNITSFMAAQRARVDEFLNFVTDQLSENQALNLQSQINSLTTKVNTNANQAIVDQPLSEHLKLI
jgi:hypothetical protein